MRAKREQKASDPQGKLRLYLSITLLFALLAIAVTLVPKGNALSRCNGIILVQSRDACFYSLAASTHNQSVCSLIQGGSAGGCYSAVAESILSPSTCQRAGSNSSVASCIAYIALATNSTLTCASLAAPYADRCLTSIAVKAGSLAICAKESNASNSQICSSVINLDLAYATLRPSYCAQASSSASKAILASIINQTRGILPKGNASILSSIGSLAFLPNQNYSARDICYMVLAFRTSNPALCANESASAQGLCAYALRNYTNSSPTTYGQLLSSCAQFGQYRSICTQSVLLAQAINTKNISICAAFQAQLATECYSSIAAKYRNASFCGYISNSTANNACLLQIK